jgi:DNA mismatch repair protein MutS
VLVDDATLRDLDTFTSPNASRRPGQAGLTLLEYVDRTQSRAGREALRHRLRNSEQSWAAIRGAQAATRAFASSSFRCRELLDEADLDAVEQYLGSNWHIPAPNAGASRLVSGYLSAGWWQDYLRAVEGGRLRIRRLLTAATQLQSRLATENGTLLGSLSRELSSLLASRELTQLAQLAPRPRVARLAFDQLAREGGKHQVLALVQILARVEALWSLGSATIERGWTYPEPAETLCVEQLRHPFLGADGVPNDLVLEGQVRVCFVTGPNMAGKSTFLKALAVSLLLAHAGCGVPAASMRFPVFRALFSSMRVSESLGAGESLYLAEVRRVRALAHALAEDGGVAAILDEPLRGTNVHDAAEATLAVVTRLAAHPRALVFVASHIGEVVPAIAGDPRIRLLQFSADVDGDEPRFDYRVRDGVSTQRLGMTLLKREGVLDMLEHRSSSFVVRRS